MHYLNFSVANPISAKIIDMIQNLMTTVDSAHPFFSKWWWSGAIINTLFPVSLYETTWIITETVSRTNKPPTIAKTISCFEIMLTAPREPPKDNEPVSPMKIFAGGALYHRKPRQDPTMEPQKIEASPTSAM